MYIIKIKHLTCSLHITFDYDEFIFTTNLKEDHSKSGGVQCGNVIWINNTLEEKDISKFIVHELCHYLDWLWEFEFKINNSYDSTEIRARLQQELFKEIIEMYEEQKNIK